MEGDRDSSRAKRKSAISARDAQIAMYLQDRPMISDMRAAKACFESSASTFAVANSKPGRIIASSIKDRTKSSSTPRERNTSNTSKSFESDKAPTQTKSQPKNATAESKRNDEDPEDKGRVKRRSAVAAEDAQFARHLQDREYTVRKYSKMSEEEDLAHHHLSRNPAG